MRLLEHHGVRPQVGKRVFVADDATLIGDVQVADEASIWFGCVLRGDVEKIRIGARTNIQDCTVVHVSSSGIGTYVGEGVTVGHRATLHATTVGDGCLIGIGSILMDGSEVGAGSIVGAGALVPPGMKIPPGVLAIGAPAKVKRPLTDGERQWLSESAANYVTLAASYLR